MVVDRNLNDVAYFGLTFSAQERDVHVLVELLEEAAVEDNANAMHQVVEQFFRTPRKIEDWFPPRETNERAFVEISDMTFEQCEQLRQKLKPVMKPIRIDKQAMASQSKPSIPGFKRTTHQAKTSKQRLIDTKTI
ncbi:hypothetical protein FI667_g14346, partial [Globisporangium splendens]